jgi:hypothetical protein
MTAGQKAARTRKRRAAARKAAITRAKNAYYRRGPLTVEKGYWLMEAAGHGKDKMTPRTFLKRARELWRTQ